MWICTRWWRSWWWWCCKSILLGSWFPFVLSIVRIHFTHIIFYRIETRLEFFSFWFIWYRQFPERFYYFNSYCRVYKHNSFFDKNFSLKYSSSPPSQMRCCVLVFEFFLPKFHRCLDTLRMFGCTKNSKILLSTDPTKYIAISIFRWKQVSSNFGALFLVISQQLFTKTQHIISLEKPSKCIQQKSFWLFVPYDCNPIRTVCILYSTRQIHFAIRNKVLKYECGIHFVWMEILRIVDCILFVTMEKWAQKSSNLYSRRDAIH